MWIKFTKFKIRVLSVLFSVASLNAKNDKKSFKNAVSLPVSNYNPCRYYFPNTDGFDCKKTAKKTKDCLRRQIADYKEEVKKLSRATPDLIKTIQGAKFKPKKLKTAMKHTLYKPCSKLIKFYPYLENQHAVVAEYGFKYFKVDVNHAKFFDEEKTFDDFIARSRWQSHIDRYGFSSPKSLQTLKKIISDLYEKFRNEFKTQRESGKKLKDMFYTADIGLLRECNQESACINLGGQISLSFYPDRKKFDIKQIGAFYETKYIKNPNFKRNMFAEAIKTTSSENIENLVSTSKHIVSVKNMISEKFGWKSTSRKDEFNSDTDKCDFKTASKLSSKIFDELLDADCEVSKPKVNKKQTGEVNENDDDNQNKGQKKLYNSSSENRTRNARSSSYFDQLSTLTRKRRSSRFEAQKFSRFKDEFKKILQTKMNSLAKDLVARDFERSACMLDKLESDINERTKFKYWESLTNDNLGRNIYTFLNGLFRKVYVKEDRYGNPCEYCRTSLMRAKAQEFLDDVKALKKEIDEYYAQKLTASVSQPFVHEHKLGEYGYIYYEVVAFVNDYKADYGSDKQSLDCLFLKDKKGCPVINQDTSRKPNDIHLAMFVHYSERKIDLESKAVKSYVSDMNLANRLKEEQMKTYFEYNLMLAMEEEADNQNMNLVKPYIKDEDKMKLVRLDLEGRTRNTCPKVIQTMEACHNRNGEKNRHFIFVLDGSYSISSTDFKKMKQTLESMLYYPLNGQNKISVMEFSRSNQQRTLCRDIRFVDDVKSCLYKYSQFKGSTHFTPAINYVKNNLLDRFHDNVIIYITDGKPSDGMAGCRAAKKLQRNSIVTSQTAYGIGDVFSDSSAIKYLGNECLSSDANFDLRDRYIEDFDKFDALRLFYQENICNLK